MAGFDIAVYVATSDSGGKIAKGLEDAGKGLKCEVFHDKDQILDSPDSFDCFVDFSGLNSEEDLVFLERIKDRRPDLPVVVSAAGSDVELIGEAVKSGLGQVIPGEKSSRDFEEIVKVLKSEIKSRDLERRSKELENIFDKISDAVYLKDCDGTYKLANPAAADIFGVEPDEVVGSKDSEFFNDEDFEDIRENDRKVVEEGVEVFNHATRKLEGEDVYFINSKRPYREDGEIKGVIGVSRDVTEERRKDRRLEAIFNNSREIIVIIDTDRTVLRVNNTAEQVLGREKEDLEDVKFGEYSFFFSEERSKALFERAVDGEAVSETVEVEIDSKTRIMEVSLTPIQDEDGEVKSVLVEAYDITDLKSNEKQLEAAFNSSYQMMGVLDTDGGVLRINSAVEDFFDVSREEVIGRHYSDLLDFIGDRDIMRMYKQFLQSSHFQKLQERGFYRQEIHLEKGDGQTAKLDVSLKAVRDGKGEMTAILAEARDVTQTKMDRRQLEDQKRRLERFSSIVSHDLRNPLNVASGYIELAKQSGKDEDFDRAMKAIDRMDQIIMELLEISGKPEHFDKSSLDLEEVFEEAYSHTDVEPDYKIEDSMEFKGGRSGVVRIFENLIRNTAEHNDDAEIEIGVIKKGFYYEDDGSIDKDIEKILEYGYSTSTEGNGLGLSVVQRVADINDWDLNIAKNKNGGLRFEFLLEA